MGKKAMTDYIHCAGCLVKERRIIQLQIENVELKRSISIFGGYVVAELLEVIANDYKNSHAADIVRDARSIWLKDFANFLTSKIRPTQ